MTFLDMSRGQSPGQWPQRTGAIALSGAIVDANVEFGRVPGTVPGAWPQRTV